MHAERHLDLLDVSEISALRNDFRQEQITGDPFSDHDCHIFHPSIEEVPRPVRNAKKMTELILIHVFFI